MVHGGRAPPHGHGPPAHRAGGRVRATNALRGSGAAGPLRSSALLLLLLGGVPLRGTREYMPAPAPPATPPQVRVKHRTGDVGRTPPRRPTHRRSRSQPDAEQSQDLRRVDWSSEVPSLLRGRAADEHDPLQREYFRVNELYTRRLSTRLADDRDSSDRFLRLVCQARWAGVEENRAVELVLDETHIQGAEPLGRLQLFAQDDDTPTQSRPEWLWRLNDGIIESRVDGYAMCLQQDKSIRARQLHRADLSKQSWTLTDQGQLQHNDTGLLLGVDGQFLVARTAADLGVGVGSGDTMSSPSIKWAIHRHDVQTLRVQVRAKRTSKWRDAKQRMIVATVGRYERAALLAMEDSNRNARLPPAELEALNIQLETLIEDGHGLRDLLLVVQALAESKFEAGQVRQCVRVYMAAARRLLQEVQVDSGQTEDEPQPESQPEPEPEPEPESRRATESEPEPEPEQVALSTEVVSAEHGDSTEAVVMAYPAEESGDAATEKKDLTKELSEDQSAASIGSKLNRATTRTSVHAVASKNNGVPDYVKRLQTMQHANAHDVAAELEREHAAHASTTQELEESLRAALAIPVDAPLEERCAAFRQAFCGRAISTQPLTSMQIIPDHGLELHRLPRDLLMKRGSSKSSANPSTEKEFWPIFRNTYTGLPCLGRNVVLKQIEPPPVVIDDDGKETEIVDCHTARKIQFGPLPERDGRPGEMWELQWDQEGKKDWPTLLRVLQQLTGQVAWHRTVHSHRAELDFEDDDDTHIEENAVDSENQQEIMAPRQMCSSSQFSFTIPPTVCDRSAFLIRVRFGADTKLIGGSWKWQTDDTADARGWINPLTWRNGDYFSPKFRRQTEYFVRPDRAEVLPPPPVVLGKTWESAHIIKHDHDDTIEREGDLRIFSILGLTPSCTANGAKVFGYGASRVEVEIATAYGMTWEEANLEDNLWIWKVAYDVPPEPIGTVLVKTFVEAMRYRGLPAIEESLMGQVDRNRKRNIKVIREFVEESWEKLQPWYAYKVQPWLASHSLTYLLVDESRAMLLREKTRFLLDKLGVSIPVEFKRDRPMIETVIVRAVPQGTIMLQWENARGVIIPERFGRSRFGRGAAGRATAPLEAIITTGQAFSVEAVALRSPVEHEEPAAHARWRALRRMQLGGDSEESSTYVYRRKVQLWWHVARASELLPDEIKDPQIMIGGQRLDGTQVPVQSFRECNVSPVRICVPVADERDEFAPCFSQLNFRGVRDGTLYPVHDADTEFVLQLTAVEEGAHEMHSLDILFRIVADEQADVADRASAGSEDRWENAQNAIGQRQSQDTPNTRSESDDEDESDNEISNEDEWPPLDLGTPPDVGDMLARIPERFESLLLVFRDGVYSRLDVPRPWGLRLEDSVSWSVMQRSFERATLRWLRTSLGQNQLPPAWTEDARAAWRDAQPAGDDADFWDAVLSLVSEVLKLKLVDSYQKNKQKLCVLEQASSAERAQMSADKKAAAASLVDGGAEQREMAIDPMDLEAAELTDILVIVLKRLLKIEIRELVLQDVQPAFRRVSACIFIFIGIGLAYYSYVVYASPDNLDGGLSRAPGGGSIGQTEVGALRQCVDQLEAGGAADGQIRSAAAELAAVVERLAALVERLETTAADPGE